MGFYNDHILPCVCDLAMRNKHLRPYRERAIGSGRNLPFYRPPVKEVLALEPSPKLIAMARHALHPGVPVNFIEASAEAIPLEDRSVDTVVTTWTLCSIPEAATALSEMRRVLRPNGRLLFVEHGMAPDENVRRWQDWLTPAWKRIGGGCHLNRPIRTMIESAGFRIDRLEAGYMPGPRPMTFMYEGIARPNPGMNP